MSKSYWTSKGRCIKEKKDIMNNIIKDLKSLDQCECGDATHVLHANIEDLINKYKEKKDEIQTI